MQLDLFADSRDVALLNEVVKAFANHDLSAADTAIAALHDQFPRHQALADYRLLLGQLRDFAEGSSREQLAERRQQLVEAILPLAQPLFGAVDTPRWAAPLWRQLAQLATALPYAPGTGERHAAALWLAAGDDTQARAAIEAIPSWRKIPEPLSWMAAVELRSNQAERYWPLLAELAWLTPERLERLIEQAPTTIRHWAQRFAADFENNSDEPDLAWFPAWLLVTAPELRDFLRPAQAGSRPSAQAFSRLLDLLHLEKTGQHRELIALRDKLRAVAPDIFAIYLRSR